MHHLVEELEQQVNQEKEQLKQKEELKERELREELNNKVQEKEKLLNDLVQQYEKASFKVEELQKTRMTIAQEKEKLLQEKEDLQRKLEESQEMLNDCKVYIDTLQKKAREERRRRAKAAIELSEGIALERETLVRQLDITHDDNARDGDLEHIDETEEYEEVFKQYPNNNMLGSHSRRSSQKIPRPFINESSGVYSTSQ
ncbi:unnamed protein product [Trichobilharzia regenti]|nr:unnamed protein product [Trichobilharzia regenti]